MTTTTTRRPDRRPRPSAPLRIGVGGPVGSGKTALVAALCRTLGDDLRLAVVTNDIYTTEDADFLRRAAVLARGAHPRRRDRLLPAHRHPRRHRRQPRRRRGPGGPVRPARPGHRGERRRQPDRHLHRGLADAQIFVLDVAGGDKVPRKGGPGVTTADLLVINKTDLAPLVGADLDVMARDAAAVRGDRPVLFTSIRQDPSAPPWRPGYSNRPCPGPTSTV